MKKSLLVLLGLSVPFSAMAQTTTTTVPTTSITTLTSTTTISGLVKIDEEIAKVNKEIKDLQETRAKKDSDLNKCAKSVKGFKIAGISTLSATGILGGVNIYQAVQRDKTGDKIEDLTVIRKQIDSIITMIVEGRTITKADLDFLLLHKDKLTNSDKAKLSEKIIYVTGMTQEDMSRYESLFSEIGITITIEIFEEEVGSGASCINLAEILGLSNRAWDDTITQDKCCEDSGYVVWQITENPKPKNTERVMNTEPRCEITLAGIKHAYELAGKCFDSKLSNMYPFTKEAQEWFDTEAEKCKKQNPK